ncbi:MAG: hypothetical protein WA642_04455 [Steroidobacteraceae bacterium]
MTIVPLELLVIGICRLWLYIQRGVLTFQVKWYESEIKYIDKRIAQLERELADQ